MASEQDGEQTEKLTEDVLAQRFVERYAGRFVFDHSKGAWSEFDGSTWHVSQTPAAFHAVRELCRSVSISTKTQTALQKVRFVKGTEEFARCDPAMARNAHSWNADPYLLGTPAGTVNLTTGRMRSSNASDMINRCTAVPPAPEAKCPMWLRFLDQVTGGDEKLVRFLQQICGYALTGDTREQALFFVYGPGGNGKSVFLDTLTHILGEYAATATMDVLTSTRTGGATTDLAMLNGARFVSSSETEEGVPWAEARIKRMTGGDAITARFMRQDNVTFTPVFKLMIIGNHKPTLKSPDEAMRRRFNVIPFTVNPERKDRLLKERLLKEAPEILRWMIDGCLDWQANGLERPPVVQEATETYFEEQDTLGHWLETKCERGRGLSNPFTPLFASWKSFALSVGENPGTGKALAENLQKAGFRKTRTRNGMEYQGLRLSYDDADRDGA